MNYHLMRVKLPIPHNQNPVHPIALAPSHGRRPPTPTGADWRGRCRYRHCGDGAGNRDHWGRQVAATVSAITESLARRGRPAPASAAGGALVRRRGGPDETSRVG